MTSPKHFILLVWLSSLLTIWAQPVPPPVATGTTLHAATNQLDWNAGMTMLLNRQAVQRSLAYTRFVAAYSSNRVQMATNGTVARLAGGLTLVYNTIGSTSLVDAAFLGGGFTVTNGTNFPSLYGRRVGSTAPTFTAGGLACNGTNTGINWLGLPAQTTVPHTIAIRVAGNTNPTVSAGNQTLYYLINSAGLATCMLSSSLSTSPGYSVYGTAFNLTGSLQGRPNSGQPGEGLYRGKRQFANAVFVISTNLATGRTNLSGWVNGLLCIDATNHVVTATPGVARLQLGIKEDGTEPLSGTIQQIWYFNRSLSSNEVSVLDQAMDYIAGSVPILCYGDDISAFDPSNPGREWPQQMFNALGSETNQVVLLNHAYQGHTALMSLTNFAQSAYARAPYWNGTKAPGHVFVNIGGLDIAANSASATNAWFNASNICFLARSNGAIVHLCTPLPLATNYASFDLNKASNMMQLRLYMLGASNQVPRLYDYLWDFHTIVTVTNNTSQLWDGFQPTNSISTSMGRMIGTNSANWLFRLPVQ
jgi:hypothetical protein